jgi:hypothetical protein
MKSAEHRALLGAATSIAALVFLVDLTMLAPSVARHLAGIDSGDPASAAAIWGIGELWLCARARALYLIPVIVLSAPFLAMYRADAREGKYLVQPDVTLAISGGAGLLALGNALRSRLARGRRLHRSAEAVGVLTLPPWAVKGYGDFNLHDDWQAWDYARATLLRASARAVIETSTDQHTLARWYAQPAQHRRPDAAVIDRRLRDPMQQR